MTPAIIALERATITHTVHRYRHGPDAGSSTGASWGLDAAAALGVDPKRVLKTLVAEVDGVVTVAVVPVTGSLDLKALAATCGGRRAVMADAQVARRSTGYVLGGISPLGQRQPHPTVVDASALDHTTVLVSAGRRGLEVELAPQDLVASTSASVGSIGS